MTEAPPKKQKQMPRGGRKGGRRFPQYPLNDAIKWAEKLVSKTHSGPQPDDLIKAGVVEAKSGAGDMRISALKQFGLMEGTSKGYSATDLAKELRSAPDEEKRPLYVRAALRPEVFKAIYETYQGDSIPTAKLKQRAADLQVHPDASAKCVEVYVETMEFAGLVTRNGDTLVHIAKEEVSSSDPIETGMEENTPEVQDPTENHGVEDKAHNTGGTPTRRGVATVQVNINLDSTLDTEKLQRQLELLRRYGAL